MNNIFLIENHNEALNIWRRNGIKNIDLLHIDAHIDLDFPQIKPLEKIVNQANNLKDLKKNLEYNLYLKYYKKGFDKFDKKVDSGNYIYKACSEGIVRDFYWVIPAKRGEFKKIEKMLVRYIKYLAKRDPYNNTFKIKSYKLKIQNDRIEATLMRHRLIVATLDSLAVLNNRVLLDVDTDFLVTDSLKHESIFTMIGKRKPWISTLDFVNILREKIKNPEIITISYSLSGGYTPIRYKYLADEIAYYFCPNKFKKRYKKALLAAEKFKLFTLKGEAGYYRQAVSLDPVYASADNNYGNLYLAKGQLKKAWAEFNKIAKVEPTNPFVLTGLGRLSLEKKEYETAKKYFSLALREKRDIPEAVFGLGYAEFNLKNFLRAKRLFARIRRNIGFNPRIERFLQLTHKMIGK